MRETQKKLIIMDCKIMLKRFGDIPLDVLHNSGNFQRELWSIGDKYGVSGSDVFMILMDNFPKKGGIK